MRLNRPPLKYHGGKWMLGKWIISHLPTHEIYAEPYGGGGSVLLRKPRVKYEFYNDLDGAVVNVFRVLQDPDLAQRLTELIRVTPFSRAEFELSYEISDDPVEAARRILIRSHMGFATTSMRNNRTGFRSKTLREHSPPAKTWGLFPDSIQAFTDRLRGVCIDCRPAIKMIRHLDDERTLFYLDPPYVISTRENSHVYQYEMSDDDHVEMLDLLLELRGKVVISGYENEIYLEKLSSWRMITRDHFANGHHGRSDRVECLWLSPNIEPNQRSLF